MRLLSQHGSGRSQFAVLLAGALLPLTPADFELAWAAEATAKVPGVVVNHRPAGSGEYLGSPSLAVLPDGSYVASHDLFGPGSTLDRTLVFASADQGRSWRARAELAGQWWSSLFVHRGALYLMGTSRENGEAVIRRSQDGGVTWTMPRDAHTGLLIGGGKYHCAPVPVVRHRGRLWRGMEDAMGPGGWGTHFHAFMMSCPENADLLEATNWTASNRLGQDPSWLDGKFGGWLEGNAVVSPDGGVLDILRVDCHHASEKAAIVRLSPDGRTATFAASDDFVDFPGGAKKFTIRQDPRSPQYWALANYVPEEFRGPNPDRTRNTLALIQSKELRHWSVRAVLLQHPEPARHGFQYADWQFEGEDLIALVRTAYDDDTGGAHNYHDANYVTFHRIRQFRQSAPRAE